jgi:hypothetical protein
MANYEEFMDPNSAIARIIAQMQGAATRSNPGIGPEQIQRALPPGGAQAPVGVGPGQNEIMTGSEDPNDLIARLLANQ